MLCGVLTGATRCRDQAFAFCFGVAAGITMVVSLIVVLLAVVLLEVVLLAAVSLTAAVVSMAAAAPVVVSLAADMLFVTTVSRPFSISLGLKG